MTAPRISWYLRRLSRMSPVEVAGRAGDHLHRMTLAPRQVSPGAVPPRARGVLTARSFGTVLAEDVVDEVPPEAAAAVIAAAERVLDGRWTALGVVRTDSAEPDWFHDPITGVRAPDGKLAFRIHHRDEAETGNIKQVWELSRHHQISVLAAAWWLTQDERYASAAAEQLQSWWSANPFLSGVHWTSGIEAGIRLISWAWVRRLLADWPKVRDLFEDNDDALRQIAWHQEFLATFESRGSSANNHVLAEAAGRLVAACAFPWYRSSQRWREQAARLLERQLAANTFADGLNRELATDYHRFVLELVLVAAVEADASGHELSEPTWQTIARMLDAGAAILDVSGRPPRQGDGDEGRGLVVDDPDRDPWAVALGSGREVLGAPAWWPATAGSLQATLLGALARQYDPVRQGARAGTLERQATRPDTFPHAGCAILRTPAADGPEIWCRCDGGPHGFLSIAAHAHADALSVEVRHDGVELLVDPGTYCYHGEPRWREWFRSTLAHNTVQIAGLDQAQSGGPFLWTAHPKVQELSSNIGPQPVQTWAAQHTGYGRLKTPVVHRRTVTLDARKRRLTVVDRFATSREVPAVVAFHLGPDVEAVLDGRHARLTWTGPSGACRGLLTLPGDLEWTAHRGETDPVRGWYSPGFGHRVPCTSLLGSGGVSAATSLTTVLELP